MSTHVSPSEVSPRGAASSRPKTPPQVSGAPVVGVLPELLRDPPAAITRITRRHAGEVVSVPLGPVRMLLLTHPDHYQHVLQDHWRNFPKGGGMWKPIRRLLGNGLVTSDGDVWLRSRQILQPLFSPKGVAGLHEIMVETIAQVIDELERSGKVGQRVDFAAEMPVITERVLFSTMLGDSLERREADGLAAAVMEAFRKINNRVFLHFVPEWVPLPGEAALRRSIQQIDEAMYKRIAERRTNAGGRDIVSLLLAAHGEQAMSDQQIRDEAVTAFVAGSETTALVMTWMFWLLDTHPAIEARVRAEIADVAGTRRPTHDELARLTYTRMVIQETMRLYPPAWMLLRTVAEDDEVGGFAIPRGSSIFMCPAALHRDPAAWDRPDAFDPDRFTPERSERRHKYAYLPFGGGPRTCIGNTFAMQEALLIAVMMIQRFRPRHAPGHTVIPVAATTLRPKGGMPMILAGA